MGGALEMTKISQLGLLVYLLNFIVMLVMICLNQQIPGFMVYIFWVAIAVTIGGSLNRRVGKLQGR